MIRGLYTSGWSMLANNKKLDVISNNLANADTNGYKKDTVVFQSFPDLLTKRINDTQSKLNPSGNIGSMQLGSDIGEVYTYYNQGQMAKTDDNLDMAIQDTGSAFFTVGVDDGNGNLKQYYTRDGAFILNSNGQIATNDGNVVLGEDGKPITLNGDNFTVQGDGTIIQNNQEVGKLLITQFTDTTSLRKFGSNLVEATGTSVQQPFNGSVAQGYLEQSNVNIVKEMVDMISVMRSYETNQKMVQIEDSTLDKAVNEVGAIR